MPLWMYSMLLAFGLFLGGGTGFAVATPTGVGAGANATPVDKGACCKICRKGCACGNSCISCSKTCHKGPGCACNG